MKELLEACQKFIAQISPSRGDDYYDIDPQDLKEFCDVVEAAQHRVHLTAGISPVFSIIDKVKLYRSLWLILARRK